MIVGGEVGDVTLDVVNGFRVFFRERTKVGVAEILAFCEAHQLVGEILVKDEAENVVLLIVGLDFRAHLVGRFPDFGGELLFVQI